MSLSVADLKDIQAGPVVNVPASNIAYLFFSITNVGDFRKLFRERVLPHITTSDSARSVIPTTNVSFSNRGLKKLYPCVDHLFGEAAELAFEEGQEKRATSFGDDTAKWLPEFNGNETDDLSIDGLFIVTGHDSNRVQTVLKTEIVDVLSNAITIVFLHGAQERPGEQKGHEHFGFNDGISQPFVKFEDDGDQRKELPGQIVVDPGVLVLGQRGDATPRPLRAKNGSFLVYRHLKQLVPEFNAFLEATVLNSIVVGSSVSLSISTTSEDFKKRVDFLGARLMGRWKSGTPIVFTPMKGGEIPVDDPTIGKDPKRNNNFNYGDPQEQLKCPFAAHTRKTVPRTSTEQKQHMIRRASIPYGPELSDEEKSETRQERGLSFVCYQSSLENGFELIQKGWCNTESCPVRECWGRSNRWPRPRP